MITFPKIGYLGRLGNQMFQFASTVGIAKRLGYEPRFPLDNCRVFFPAGPFSRERGSNENIKCDLMEAFEIPEDYFINSSDIKIDYLYNESKFEFNEETKELPDNCGISGYYQSEKYFKEYRDLILSIFSFKSPYKDLAVQYMENIRKDDKSSVLASIHVRRGDYLMYPDHHPVCTKEYQESARKILKEKYGDVRFLVFSDDVEWCKNTFRNEEYTIVNLGNPYSEMLAMSLCDHHIIANSSFSWWGAWLNPKRDKTVIAPNNWFGPAINKNTQDVYCEDWVKI